MLAACLSVAAHGAVLTQQRLDVLLVNRGLCTSRTQAKAAVKAGHVIVDGEIVKKPSLSLAESANVEVAAAATGPYVSRAGEKLRAAINGLSLDLDGASILDVGASTGGFTDCALQAGAASAVCVDVGHGQLHPRLQNDSRVTSLEGVNARALTAEMLPRASYDLIVVDVSFISLRLVLPALWPLLADEPDARLVALVKPQFEAGKEVVAKGRGIVRDPQVHERVVNEICGFAQTELPGCQVIGRFESPILGGDGNKEFLVALAPTAPALPKRTPLPH